MSGLEVVAMPGIFTARFPFRFWDNLIPRPNTRSEPAFSFVGTTLAIDAFTKYTRLARRLDITLATQKICLF